VLQHEGDPSRCAVILPGVRYFSQAPLLWFVREVAQAHGWSVIEVDERAPQDEEPFEWMRGQARRALDAAAGADRVVVIGKSLGSAAAPMVSGPAIWLTPLLIRREVAESILAATAPTLLVGGTGDEAWDTDLAATLPAERLELPGADHGLEVADPFASLDLLRWVTERIDAFAAGLETGSDL
jgi:pimeloyl-ACP methyl ester carboxylesterase